MDLHKAHTLTPAFVQAKYSAGFCKQVMMLGSTNHKKYINISPGKDKCYRKLPELALEAPSIHYLQGENQRSCLTFSFASALHYVGAKQIVSEVYCMSDKEIKKHITLILFCSMMQTQSCPLNFKLLELSYNILENAEDALVIAVLCGKDGKRDHCVTVYGRWIFDLNIEHAFPLTRASLDTCCSLKDTEDKFDHVVTAKLCTNYMKWIDKKRKR